MSPEQAEMSEQGIDTRSDVYALGVVLYELLTGVLPFDAESLRSRGLEEIHRVIREVDPPKPSTRLSSITHESADSGAAVSKSRRTDIRSLSRRLRADLDWVVMRCLEKDRGRRYDTASELAADLKRFLQHEPVVAGPPTVGYRVKKFVRRHRVGVGTAGAVAAALVLGLAGVTWQWSRAELARERAQASEAQALELAGRLVGTFHDRVAPLPGALAVRDEFARLAIDHLERLRDRRGDDDRTILDIAEGYGRVGDVQAGRLLARRGDLAGAERSYERELALTREVRDARPSDDPEVLVALARARARLAATRQEQERQPEAADLCREAIVLLDRVPDPARDTRWRETRGWLGVRLAAAVAQAPTEARDPEERQRELTLAADLLRQVVVDSPSIHARLMLARALHGMAERLWERAQEEQNDALKAELRVRTLQRLADELAQLRSVVESVPAHVGARHDLAAAAYWNAILLRMDGRAQDALDATGEAERHLAFLAEAEPTDHQSRLESGRVEELRALTLRSLDRPAEALEATDRGLALIDALIVESPGHPEYRRVRIGLLEQRCRAAAKLGDSRLLNSAAQSMFREADRWDQAHPGDVDWTARRMALGAQFANAALGPLLAGPEGDALVVQTRLFVEDLDRALDRWRSQAAYEARAAALARARGDIAALLDDAG
jgi:tetratricopeptide (TPR) repeat protein